MALPSKRSGAAAGTAEGVQRTLAEVVRTTAKTLQAAKPAELERLLGAHAHCLLQRGAGGLDCRLCWWLGCASGWAALLAALHYVYLCCAGWCGLWRAGLNMLGFAGVECTTAAANDISTSTHFSLQTLEGSSAAGTAGAAQRCLKSWFLR